MRDILYRLTKLNVDVRPLHLSSLYLHVTSKHQGINKLPHKFLSYHFKPHDFNHIHLRLDLLNAAKFRMLKY